MTNREVTPATHLFGVRVWASWSEMMTPHFRLLHYLGMDNYGVHYFCFRGTTAVITKTTEQITAGINSGSFKPFCINMEQV